LPEPSAPPHASRVARVVLFLAGVVAWAWLQQTVMKWLPWTALAIPSVVALAGATVAFVPHLGERLSRVIDRLRHPSPRTRANVSLAVAVISAMYLAVTAYSHGREFFPRIHDEHSYLLGAHMLARGRLWMPQHPLAGFFESFHILVKPVYASIYFPGTALMYVPGVWLGLPGWVTALLISAAVVGLTYRVVTELLDGVAGLLAVFILLGNGTFRVFSTVVMAQLPAAMLGLAMIWAWLRWRREHRAAWAAVLGAAAGWAAIARPVDALVYALPLGVAIAWALRAKPARAWVTTGSVIVASATPFLLLQVAFNLGVTGKALDTPYVKYLQQNQPGSTFGSTVDSATTSPARPASALPQKQIYFQQLIENERGLRASGTVTWFAQRLALTIWHTLPSASMLVLVPAIVLTKGRFGGIGIVLAVPILFLALYALNPLFMPYYPLAIGPCVACWVLVGAAALTGSHRRPSAAMDLAILAVCLAAMPEVNPLISDGSQEMMVMSTAERELGRIDDAPAVVLFRFHPGTSAHEEPVYNSSVAWPDDAPVIRAHDLGPTRNTEIFDYYGSGRHGPSRTFYLFDRGTGELIRLGSGQEAAARLARYDAESL
jgi:hypothetical protein